MNELKSLKNAPPAIKLLMEAICVLMKIEPIRTKSKDGFTITNDYWAAATGRSVLGNPKLLEMLSKFDHH